MTTMNDIFPSPFLAKEDFNKPYALTIKAFGMEEVGDDKKFVLEFSETNKKLVCNKINASRIELMHGGNIEQWVGKKVTFFNDPTVEFAGRLTGGIRVQVPVPGMDTPMPSSPPMDQQQVENENNLAEFDDEIPF